MQGNRFTVLVGAVILCLSSLNAVAKPVYRYMNEKGVLVINDKVPPEFVAKGYDILDGNSLTLIQRVPRQLSDEEIKLHNTEESRARLKQEEERRLQTWDESLLLRYSSTDDIEAAQKRAVQDLQIRISILKSNLVTIKSQIEREQEKAADIERRGMAVPEEMAKNIHILKLEIEDTEQSIAVRREEIDAVKAAYQRDIDRFVTLQDRVQMRRQSANTPPPEKRFSH